jgi:hypothetical protein
VRYRSEIRPHYSAFVAEGMARYGHHRALQASLQLTSGLLGGALDAVASDPNAFTFDTLPTRALRSLRDHDVSPEILFARVAEIAAWMEDHPERCVSQRWEDHALARCVLQIVPCKLRFAWGAKTLRHLGSLLRERVLPGAAAFTRKLRQDVTERHALVRASADFGAPDGVA